MLCPATLHKTQLSLAKRACNLCSTLLHKHTRQHIAYTQPSTSSRLLSCQATRTDQQNDVIDSNAEDDDDDYDDDDTDVSSSSVLVPGCLTLCATPIGNLSDVSYRLVSAINTADCIYAEDTRRTHILIQHVHKLQTHKRQHNKKTVSVFPFHAHSTQQVKTDILHRLQQGQRVLYLTDAGMPGVSDPGAELVRYIHQYVDKHQPTSVQPAHLPAVSVDVWPGPSAVTTALLLSGFESQGGRFAFLGWFPSSMEKRLELLHRLAILGCPTIFFEANTRIHYALNVLATHLPNTLIAVCRELTKKFQQLTVAKGEFTIVIDQVKEDLVGVSLSARYSALLANKYSPAQALKELSQQSKINKAHLKRMIEKERQQQPRPHDRPQQHGDDET